MGEDKEPRLPTAEIALCWSSCIFQSLYSVWKATAPERCCDGCGATYRSPFPEQHFCSYDCAHNAQRSPGRHRRCTHFERPFVCHQSGAHRQKYFSVGKAWGVEQHECSVCTRTFKAKHPASCCSQKCRNKHAHEERQRNAPQVACQSCGAVSKPHRGASTCSRPCRSELRIRAMGAKRSPLPVTSFHQRLTAVAFDKWFHRMGV